MESPLGDRRRARRLHGRPLAARAAARARDRPRARALAGRARPARPRGALPRHRQARHPGRDPAQAGDADRGGVGADAAPRRRGRADHRPPRLPRATPCPAIRHHHERFDGTRLPGRPRRRGDPARRADHPRRRRARLDADDPDLPRRAGRSRRRSQELRGAAGTQFCPRCVARARADPAARARSSDDARRAEAARRSPALVATVSATSWRQSLGRVLSDGLQTLRLLYYCWRWLASASTRAVVRHRSRRARRRSRRGSGKRYSDEEILAAAARLRRAARPLADDARVRRRRARRRCTRRR